MHDRRVAGMKPPIDDRLVRLYRVVEIAFHNDVAANADLAETLPVVRNLPAVLVRDADFAGAHELDALPRLDDRPLGHRQLLMLGPLLADEDKGRGFREAVDMRDLPAEPALDQLDGRRPLAARRR